MTLSVTVDENAPPPHCTTQSTPESLMSVSVAQFQVTPLPEPRDVSVPFPSVHADLRSRASTGRPPPHPLSALDTFRTRRALVTSEGTIPARSNSTSTRLCLSNLMRRVGLAPPFRFLFSAPMKASRVAGRVVCS